MANFQTHMTVATVASTALAAAVHSFYSIDGVYASLLLVVGSVAGILPDIDSDNSTALNWVFSILSLAAFAMALSVGYGKYPLIHVLGAAVVAVLLTQFVVRFIFERFTVHRGIFHSQLAAVMFALMATGFGFQVAGLDGQTAYWFGVFTWFGYSVHLVLDELYAVDFNNNRVKRSFGSAMKLFSLRYPVTSVAALALSLLLYSQVPNPQILADLLPRTIG